MTYREQLEDHIENSSYDTVDQADALQEISQRTEAELKEFARSACATASDLKGNADRLDLLYQEYAASEATDLKLFQAYRALWDAAVKTDCPDQL